MASPQENSNCTKYRSQQWHWGRMETYHYHSCKESLGTKHKWKRKLGLWKWVQNIAQIICDKWEAFKKLSTVTLADEIEYKKEWVISKRDWLRLSQPTLCIFKTISRLDGHGLSFPRNSSRWCSLLLKRWRPPARWFLRLNVSLPAVGNILRSGQYDSQFSASHHSRGCCPQLAMKHWA